MARRKINPGQTWSRKALALPIFLLVVSALALAGLSLYYFNSLDNQLHEIISLHNDVDDLLIIEQEFDFYAQEIFSEASVGFSRGQSESVFLDNFKKSLANYKNKRGYYAIPELAQLEQISENNIEVGDSSLLLRANAVLKQQTRDITIVYTYEKTFEKIFK